LPEPSTLHDTPGTVEAHPLPGTKLAAMHAHDGACTQPSGIGTQMYVSGGPPGPPSVPGTLATWSWQYSLLTHEMGPHWNGPPAPTGGASLVASSPASAAGPQSDASAHVDDPASLGVTAGVGGAAAPSVPASTTLVTPSSRVVRAPQ
jgi:hypothetical protein